MSASRTSAGLKLSAYSHPHAHAANHHENYHLDFNPHRSIDDDGESEPQGAPEQGKTPDNLSPPRMGWKPSPSAHDRVWTRTPAARKVRGRSRSRTEGLCTQTDPKRFFPDKAARPHRAGKSAVKHATLGGFSKGQRRALRRQARTRGRWRDPRSSHRGAQPWCDDALPLCADDTDNAKGH
jgi:hypothetical protein